MNLQNSIRFITLLAGLFAGASIVVGLWGLNWNPAAGATSVDRLALGADRSHLIGAGFWLSGIAYLLLLPAALVLTRPLTRSAALISTGSGAGYLLLGAVGALMLGASWPDLISEFAGADAAQQQRLLADADSLGHNVESVFHGSAQNLLGIIWFAGIALIRGHGVPYRTFTTILVLALALTTLGSWQDATPLASLGLSLTIGLTPVWAIWTALGSGAPLGLAESERVHSRYNGESGAA